MEKGRTMSAAENWYYAQGGRAAGPVRIEQLRTMAASGSILRTDMFWREGLPAWTPGHQLEGIFPDAGAEVIPPTTRQPADLLYASRPMFLDNRPDPSALSENPFVRLLLPIGRSGWAIAAGYLGLLSVLLLPAPLAIITAVFAFNDIRRHPARHGIGRTMFGLIMGVLGTVALMILVARR